MGKWIEQECVAVSVADLDDAELERLRAAPAAEAR